jgi:RNA polymerase sigma factor (sigma-70 family)
MTWQRGGMVDGLMPQSEPIDPPRDDPSSADPPSADPSIAAPELRVVREGDTYSDWHAIYSDNVVRIYRLMYSKVGNREDAEDLTAEVFVAAFGPLRITASRGEVRGYLLVTAQTVLASFWRRTLGAEVTKIDLDEARAFVEKPIEESDAPIRARVLLETLPERYRRILELRFLEGRSVRDAAGAMNVTVANAKVLQHRALRMAARLSEEAGR